MNQQIISNENLNGLLEEEQNALDKLMECYSMFLKLDREHPDEMRDFVDGIHKIQSVFALRVVRRIYPLGWPKR